MLEQGKVPVLVDLGYFSLKTTPSSCYLQFSEVSDWRYPRLSFLSRLCLTLTFSLARKRPLDQQQFEGEDGLKRRRTDSEAPPSTLRVLIRNSVRRLATIREI